MDFKFAIGDYVTLKAHLDLYGLASAQPAMVVGRRGEECYGGIQLHYHCRVICPPEFNYRPATFCKEPFTVLEPELVALDVEEYKRVRKES